MGIAGAQHGMQLLWALLLSGVFTYILMVAFGQLTLVTGKTALWNFKTEIPKVGKVLAIYVLAALILGELLALMGIMGIVSELIQEGIRLLTPGGGTRVETFWIIIVISMLIFLDRKSVV